MASATYRVPGMSCDHCTLAVASAVETVAGVAYVDVDLESNVVTVFGESLDDGALRAAIEDAGYEAA